MYERKKDVDAHPITLNQFVDAKNRFRRCHPVPSLSIADGRVAVAARILRHGLVLFGALCFVAGAVLTSSGAARRDRFTLRRSGSPFTVIKNRAPRSIPAIATRPRLRFTSHDLPARRFRAIGGGRG